MLARSALSNVSIFSSNGVESRDEVIRKYIQYCVTYRLSFVHTKYVIQRMIGSDQSVTDRGIKTVQAASMAEICDAWQLADFYRQSTAPDCSLSATISCPSPLAAKRKAADDGYVTTIEEMSVSLTA